MKRALAGMLIGFAFLLATGPTTGIAAPRASVNSASLPATRLEFGLSNFDPTWMNASGVPWKYRFQYLSAGVNTGSGWETWNSPTGAFATLYMNASGSYIPVFTYYELLQSNPSTGSNESDRDFSNLNNTSTMNAYYGNFKLLMQLAGAFGKQVVVHVEPDFWAYMQQRANGGDATAITASVASSGFAEAASLPNNLVGFASELKYLRDTYAPNVSLAMHASMWSSGFDLATNTDPSLNPVTEADKTAAFLNSAGAAGWDAIFNDVDDHNAAWWELVGGTTNHWWDPNNVNFPNFSRYLSWVGELHSKTGKQQVVWQVPMGNQYFLTMNNTCGHYQDNVAPYFISHTADLFNAGLVAVMFGPGNSCQTSYDDSANDGITNNNGVPTSDLPGGCNVCNTHTSIYSDDDGGYLRIFVGNYYANLSACTSVTVTPSLASPQPAGTSIVITATATKCTSPRFQFWLKSAAGWSVVQAYSPTATYTFKTTVAGSYLFSVWAQDASSPGTSGTPPNTYDAYGVLSYSLTTTTCSGETTSASPPTSTQVGTGVTITASATGCGNPMYQFYLLPPGGGWMVAQPYSTSATYSWHTNGLAGGSYLFSVWARDASSTNSYDVYSALSYSLTTTVCTGITASPSPATSAARGTPVTVTGNATGCPNPQYEFWLKLPNGTWTLARPWSSTNSFAWTTTSATVGSYLFSVWARDASSTNSYDVYGAFVYSLTSTPCTGITDSASPATSAARGTTVTVTGTGTGCSAPQYEFWLKNPAGNWFMVQGWSSSNTFTWYTGPGMLGGGYVIAVWVRDSSSSGTSGSPPNTYDAVGWFNYTLT